MPWSVLVYFLLPYAVFKLAWRGLRYRPYFQGWSERFGFVATKREQRVIWVHAVSVGEVRSASADPPGRYVLTGKLSRSSGERQFN